MIIASQAKRIVASDVVESESAFLWVVYIRYCDGRPCGYTGRPALTRLPSYFYGAASELGPSDCIMLVPR